MSPQAKKILWWSLGIAGAATLVAVVASASTSEKKTSSADIDKVVAYAIRAETDISILQTLAAKLSAAGRLTQASIVMRRVHVLTGTANVAPMPFSTNPQKTSVALFR